MSLLTCSTEGCMSAGKAVEYDLDMVDAFGQSYRVDAVVCGACSQPITDIDPPIEPPVDPSPESTSQGGGDGE